MTSSETTFNDAELIARLRLPWFTNGCEKHQLEAADRIEQLAVTNEALTKERDEARQDAKAAEDELEMQEQEACMMENDYLKLEKERDALEAKLAKAVELALEECPFRAGTPKYDKWWHHRRTTIAEIKAT